MLINSQTKIAALLKHNPDALESIINLSPDFKKLRNPFLRKLMAGRTSIAMASKIGGCKPEDFFNVLSPLGFEADDLAECEDEIQLNDKSLKQFVSDIENAHIVNLDVRPMLAEGNDPLKLIQQHIKELKHGQVLKIINTFEPGPLIALLKNQGFNTYVDHISPDLIETYFYKGKAAEFKPETSNKDTANWDNIFKSYENKLEHIDVRNMEMPGPMVAILENLDKMPAGKALYVHHKRIPVFLLNELKDRGFHYLIKEISESEVNLIIFRN